MRKVLLSHPPDSRRAPRRRRWRALAAVLTGGLVAAFLPIGGVSPAGADPAPLVTEDGLGIRIDETALTGPALTAIENELQGFAQTLIQDDVSADPPFPGVLSTSVSLDLELGLDFIAPGGGFPDGGLAVHADLENIFMDFFVDPWTPFAGNCHIFVEPDTGTVDVSAKADKSQLPGTPAVVNPVQATWDDSPAVDGDTFGCDVVVAWEGFVNAWNSFWGDDPESTASKIEDRLDGTLQDMIDDLWSQHVEPVLVSLDEGFGITVNQLRTDDHGLIVTADVDATGGITIPGAPGGPFDVSGAEDSGADSDVNSLLANRVSDDGASHVIASIHPNVANQFLFALDEVTGGQFGQPLVSADIEDVLLDPSVHDSYSDTGWSVRTTVTVPPHVDPTGPEGAPQVTLPDVTLRVFNSSYLFGIQPVATFAGTMDSIDLVTEVRAGSTDWGPAVSPDNATASLSRTQGNPDVTAHAPDPATMLPYAKGGVDFYNEITFVSFVSLAPISIGGLDVTLCATCGRYADDERYTETFKVT